MQTLFLRLCINEDSRGQQWVSVSLLLRVVPKLYSFVRWPHEPEGYKQLSVYEYSQQKTLLQTTLHLSTDSLKSTKIQKDKGEKYRTNQATKKGKQRVKWNQRNRQHQRRHSSSSTLELVFFTFVISGDFLCLFFVSIFKPIQIKIVLQKVQFSPEVFKIKSFKMTRGRRVKIKILFSVCKRGRATFSSSILIDTVRLYSCIYIYISIDSTVSQSNVHNSLQVIHNDTLDW